MIDLDLTRALRARVVPVLAEVLAERGEVDREARREIAERLLRAALDEMEPPHESSPAEVDETVAQALAEMFGLGGLDTWLARSDVSDIWGQGHDGCFVRYVDGTREPIAPFVEDDDALEALLRHAATDSDAPRRLTIADPIVEVRLADGARLSAVIEVADRPSFAIRRRRTARLGLDDLTSNGTIGTAGAQLLRRAVDERRNIVVAGATGAGKTTLLRALALAVPPTERIVTIEDTRELDLRDAANLPDVVALQSREPNPGGEGEVTLPELCRLALRLDPDRVIVGEVRGDEVIPMLTAMNQGNDGSMCTVHASSAPGALQKLALYAALSAEKLPIDVVNVLLAAAIDLVVYVSYDRRDARRYVAEIHGVRASDGVRIDTEVLYRHGGGSP